MQEPYESPQLTTVGSLTDLTLGEGWAGSDDVLFYFIRYGELS